MSYTPTQWQTGDTVTAEKLNKIESGIAAGNENYFPVVLTITAQDYSGIMNKTISQIQAAFESGKIIVFDLVVPGTGDITCIATPGFADNFVYPSFNGFLLVQSPLDALVYLWSGTTDDPDHNTYHTVIYPLTPMS